MSKVYIIPVGDVDSSLLARLLPCMEERFLFNFIAVTPLPAPDSAYNLIKKKYLSSAICEKIGFVMPADAKFAMAITELDTYDNYSNFVYNQVKSEDRVGLVSLYRLNPVHSLHCVDRDSYFQRVLKETTHEMGHLMGFRHCFDSNCVMYFSYSINDTDRKGTFFCYECEKKLNKMTSSS
jgi:archaemetzincin